MPSIRDIAQSIIETIEYPFLELSALKKQPEGKVITITVWNTDEFTKTINPPIPLTNQEPIQNVVTVSG